MEVAVIWGQGGAVVQIKYRGTRVCFALKVYTENVFLRYLDVKSVLRKYNKENMPLKKHDKNQISRLSFF